MKSDNNNFSSYYITERGFVFKSLILMMSLTFAAAAPAIAPANDEIVVEARGGAVLRSYVDRVAKPEAGRQLARWNAPLCIRYEGLGARFSSYIHARIARAAADIRLKVAGPACQAAVLIKLTNHADMLARALVKMRPPRIGNVTSPRILPPRQVAALLAPRTVRWMTASATVNQNGMIIIDGNNMLYTSSLIRSSVREDVASKIILIDSDRLAGVSLNQLADYLAFITLASPDISADFADTDSIMALFAGGSGGAPKAMTMQDRAFLDALYTLSPYRPATTQKRAIHGRIEKRMASRDD